jgi:hypothetical protein
MTDSIATSKRFETPIFDSLVPKQQHLVIAYCHLLDKTMAAKDAGYKNTNHQLKRTIAELFSDPKIVSAIDEYLSAKLEQLDSGRAAICQKLMNQSLAEMHDVAKTVPFVNASGKIITGRTMHQPLDLAEVEERFRCAMCFLKRNREGQYEWDNMSQHRATIQLSKLMMWDQSLLDQNPALVFHFGDIQSADYVAPDSEIDTSAVENKRDEVADLTH